VADRSTLESVSLASQLFDTADSSLLDLVDSLLDKGVVLDGELVLGLADVDLIYVRLSAIICAADRVFSDTR